MGRLAASLGWLFRSNMGLMALCMALFAGVYLAVDPGPSGWGSMALLLPLAGCLAMHFFMHRGDAPGKRGPDVRRGQEVSSRDDMPAGSTACESRNPMR